VIPDAWDSYSFIIRYINNPLRVEVNGDTVNVVNLSQSLITLAVYDNQVDIAPGEEKRFKKP